MNDSRSQALEACPARAAPEEQDVISLVDLWLTFRRHRAVFLRIFLGVVVSGLALVLLLPEKYDLKTSLEIGTVLQNGVPVPIEAPDTVKAKLENSYIPLMIQRLIEGQEDPESYDVFVQIPKESALVVLGSNIEEGDEQRYRVFHERLVEAVVSDHRRLINVLQKKLETELELERIKLAELSDPATLEALVSQEKKKLEEARSELAKLTDPVIFGTRLKKQENLILEKENELASYRDQQKVLEAKREGIVTQQDLLRKEIGTVEKRLRESLALQGAASQKIEDAPSAMSQLLIDSQIMEDRKWLAQLKEALFVHLENQKEATEKALEDNRRNQQLAQEKIKEAKGLLKELLSTNKLEQSTLKASIQEIEAKIQKLINDQDRLIQEQQQTVDEVMAKLDNFVETRAIVEPTRSPEPTSVSRRILFLLVLFVSIVLAAVAVFVAEVASRVKARESEK